MKILVLGASQGTGARCVKAALAKGHFVSAFSRTPAKLDVTDPALTKVAGDFHDAASVRSAVAGLVEAWGSTAFVGKGVQLGG